MSTLEACNGSRVQVGAVHDVSSISDLTICRSLFVHDPFEEQQGHSVGVRAQLLKLHESRPLFDTQAEGNDAISAKHVYGLMLRLLPDSREAYALAHAFIVNRKQGGDAAIDLLYAELGRDTMRGIRAVLQGVLLDAAYMEKKHQNRIFTDVINQVDEVLRGGLEGRLRDTYQGIRSNYIMLAKRLDPQDVVGLTDPIMSSSQVPFGKPGETKPAADVYMHNVLTAVLGPDMSEVAKKIRVVAYNAEHPSKKVMKIAEETGNSLLPIEQALKTLAAGFADDMNTYAVVERRIRQAGELANVMRREPDSDGSDLIQQMLAKLIQMFDFMKQMNIFDLYDASQRQKESGLITSAEAA